MSIIKLLAPALIVAIAVIFFSALPQARYEEPAVPLNPSPPYLDILPDQTIIQTLQGTGQPIAGFIFYSPMDKIRGYPLRIELFDQQTDTLLSSGRMDRAEYHNHTLALPFNLRPVTTQTKQPLRLAITNTSHRPIELFVNPESTFSNGRLQNHVLAQPDSDLSFMLIHPAPTPASTKQGLLAGLIILLGSILIALLPHRRYLAAALLLIIAIPIATGGFWFSTNQLGMSDWDLFSPMHEGYRQTIVNHHTFPFWNPYTFGGVAGLADPEFAVLSFNFLLELLFGVISGFRLSIYLTLIISALGMLVLGRRLGLSVHGALLAALIVSLSSSLPLRFAEGHIQYFAIGWIPWIFWSWYCAYQTNLNGKSGRWRELISRTLSRQAKRKRSEAPGFEKFNSSPSSKQATRQRGAIPRLEVPDSPPSPRKNLWPLLCGVFLALTFYQGGIYPLFHTLPALVLFIWLARSPRSAFRVTFVAGLWSFALSAFKVLPVINWIREYPDDFYHKSSFALPYWFDIYLGRHLHGSQILPNQSGGWHEYGAYIGIVVLSLAVLSLSQLTANRLIRLILLGFIVSLVLASAGPALVPTLDILTFLPRSNIIRLALFTIFSIALLAGFGLHTLQKHSSKAGRYLAPTLVGLAALDLASLAYPISEQAFTVPPVTPPIAQAAYPIAFTNETNTIRINGSDETRTFPFVAAGYGTLSHRPNTISPRSAKPNSKYVTSSEPTATIELLSWTPNHAKLKVTTPSQTTISLNGNYSRDWQVNGYQAKNHQGQVSAIVPAGTHTLNFKYRPSGYPLGLFISLIAILLAASQITLQFLRYRARTKKSANE